MTMSTHRPFLSAAHLLLLKDKRVLLIRRCNTGYEDGNYHVPAGHIEWGETALQAMIRETQEEIGITLAPGDVKPLCIVHRKANADDIRLDYFFVAKTWPGEVANQEPNKCDDVQWFERTALPANMVDYARFVIERMDTIPWYVEFGWK